MIASVSYVIAAKFNGNIYGTSVRPALLYKSEISTPEEPGDCTSDGRTLHGC